MWTTLPSARSRGMKGVKRHAKPKGFLGIEGPHVVCISPKDLNRISEVEETEQWIFQLMKSHWLGSRVYLVG